MAIENAYVGHTGVTNPGSDKTPNDTDGKELVHLLVERGADPNQQMFFRAPKERGQVSTSARGTTPFQRACASLDLELIKYLLAHGADATLATAAGETSMMVAIEGRGSEEQVIAALQVLKDAGTDVNAVQKIMYITRDHGGTALHAATKKGLKKVMAELVALGADPNIKDEDGLTALDYAMSRGWLPALSTRPAPRTDLVKVLRGLGATVEMSKTPDWPGEFPPIGPPRGPRSGDLAAVNARRWFLGASLQLAAAAGMGVFTRSAHAADIRTTPLGPGMWLLDGAGCNVVALQGPAGALLIDGGDSKNSSALLKAVARATANSKVGTLINTHWHPAQTGSNETIGREGGLIIAHEVTRLYLGRPVTSVDYAGFYGPLTPAGRPTRTTRTTGAFDFASQRVEYGYLPAAHTNGDLYVHFPERNLIVAGGPVQSQSWPMLDYRNGAGSAGWSRRTRSLQQW